MLRQFNSPLQPDLDQDAPPAFGPSFTLSPAPPIWQRPSGLDLAPAFGLRRLIGAECLYRAVSDLSRRIARRGLSRQSSFSLRSLSPAMCAALLAASGCQGAFSPGALLPGGLPGGVQTAIAPPDLAVMLDTVAGGGTDSTNGAPALQASFTSPMGVASGKGGTFVVDTARNIVRQIDLTGAVRTIAGTGQAGYNGDGPNATLQNLSAPTRVAVSSAGNIFFSDTGNHLVRCTGPDGRLLTVIGGGQTPPSTASIAGTEVALMTPMGLNFGPDGTLYVADSGLHEVLAFTTDGHVSVFAGTGSAGTTGDGGPATSARFLAPEDVAVSPSGQVDVTDAAAGTVRQIASDGTVTTIAGSPSSGFPRPTSSGDGGPATQAHFESLSGLAIGRDGAVYVADASASCIRRIGSDGKIYTVAGTGVAGFDGDTAIAAPRAKLSSPHALASTSDGRILISDTGNRRIRELTFE